MLAVAAAGPAAAGPRPPGDDPSCVQHARLLTVATVCVGGGFLWANVTVRGESVFPPTMLTVHTAELREFHGVTNGVVVGYACCWQGSSAQGPVTYTSATYAAKIGYSYQACATVSVRDAVGGTEEYGWVCSARRSY